MSQDRDNLAVLVLAEDIIDFRQAGGGPYDYEEEQAIEALVRNGIRPSMLSADLEHLMHLACRRIARGLVGRDA